MQEQNMEKRGNAFEKFLMVGAIVVGVAIVVLAIVFGKGSPVGTSSSNTQNQQRTGLEVTNEEVLGNPSAPSTIVIFLDFQCSACGMYFAQVEPQVRAKYIDTGKAKMVAKVLSFIDGEGKKGESFAAARAAECSAEQNKFWKMHDAIYSVESAEILAKKNNENDGNLTRDAFMGFAKQIGLDVDAFTACLDSNKYQTLTDDDMNDANIALNGQVATPSVFINGTHLQNPFDLTQYDALIK
jgi:protein-disulfide isomerase